MTTSIPVDTWGDQGRFPKRPRVVYRPRTAIHPEGDPEYIDVEVPTETGDLAILSLRRRCPPATAPWSWDEYTFEFSGELVDIAPEGLTAAVQLAFLALREARRLELGTAEALARLHEEDG